MRRTDLRDAAWRSVLVLTCAAVCAVGPPAALATAAAVLAAAVSLPVAVRHRRLGLADAVLTGLGGLLVAAVLTGLALDLLPWGLSRPACCFGLAAVAIAAVWSGARTRPGSSAQRSAGRTPPRPATLVTAALAGLVVLAAYGVAVRSTEAAERSPVQLSLRGGTDGGAGPVEVVASSADDLGPVELRLVTGRRSSSAGPAFRLQAGVPAVRTLTLPAGRVTVQLASPGQAAPIRTLIIDRTRGH